MKKIAATTILTLCSVIWVNAQQSNMNIRHAAISDQMPFVLSFGPRLGVNISKLVGTDPSRYRPSIGWLVGGTIDLQSRSWYSTSLDIVYNQKGYMIDGIKERETMSYVSGTLLANFHFPWLSLSVGVEPSLFVGSMHFVDGKRYWSTNRWQRLDFAVPVGVSIPLPFLYNSALDIRYSRGLVNLHKDMNASENFNSSWTLSIIKRF